MKLKYDAQIDIAVGLSAKSPSWKNKKLLWSDLVRKLKEENKTNETLKEFLSATKDEQCKIKDVGGYVGGYLRGGKRHPENVVHRQIATLDIDFAHTGLWNDFCLLFGNAAVIHATHKHCNDNPRYRLVFPLNRPVTSDEYVAITRYIAGEIGIELFDNTTFEVNRLMFWPSNPKDIEYYCEVQDGEFFDADEILNSYVDWKDTTLWPTSAKRVNELKNSAKKQEDPETKKGVIGAWCRTYGIEEAIELFLSDVYIPTLDGRYTYVNGTTASGLVVYEDKFAYSHHGTDPAGSKLCNAFDLVRLHKFGHLDSDSDVKSKSMSLMEDFARKDKKVKMTLGVENLANARYDFANEPEIIEEDNVDWMQELEVDKSGKYLPTATNISMILANDSRLKDKFKKNLFESRDYIFDSVPWRTVIKPGPVKNVDYAGLRNYIESIYGISSSMKVEDALALTFDKNSFNPVKEYLNSLHWDGIERLNTLLVDYFGTPNDIYFRESGSKPWIAAVARAMNPGCKFDLVLTLVGKQGTGKSTFPRKLGGAWFSDTFFTVSGKEALEQIQGAWIIEIAELSGFKKAEIEGVKHFITKQVDTFRPAYGHVVETYPRQCIFVATTNDDNFLKDPSGNRRFLPVAINPEKATKSVFTDLTQNEVDQIWAEAVERYLSFENLYLSDKAEQLANVIRGNHQESDERSGIIERYLEAKLPNNWNKTDIAGRRYYFEGEELTGTKQREEVCVAEVWCECLGKAKEDMSRYATKDINEILRNLSGWESQKITKTFPIYGTQRYYKRVKRVKIE